jgi:DNA replication and repair protein RecF
MITNIQLKNFRNYANLSLGFQKKTNLLIGTNGQGKTNLLEAIFFIGMLRSFRTSSIRDLQKVGTKNFFLSASVDRGRGWDELLEVEYAEKRRLRIDSAPIQKASEFIGNIKTVSFSPSDIMLVTESTGQRRRFLNMLISSFSKPYLAALNEYAQALKMRNTLLKASRVDAATISAFEHIMAKSGSAVVKQRKKVLGALSGEMLSLITEIKGGSPVFSIKYNHHPATSGEESFSAKLANERTKETARGYSLFGPHLDDFEFILEDKSLRHFGSTGQCRLASLCLKMAAVNILREDNSQVITLVDDVTGDLDAKTRDAFLKIISKSEQSFFTFTEKPEDEYFSDVATFAIENGQVAVIK